MLGGVFSEQSSAQRQTTFKYRNFSCNCVGLVLCFHKQLNISIIFLRLNSSERFQIILSGIASKFRKCLGKNSFNPILVKVCVVNPD